MVTEDQSEVIAFLLRPDTYGAGTTRVEHLETHSAMVFLAGDRALKLKRAVRYDYLDFSTAERRRRWCEAEVALNRRMAPAIYRGTAAVTRESSGRLALDGTGTPVEWLVDMTRFDGEALADRLAESGTLPLTAMAPLAASVAALHAGAAHRLDAGGAAGMRWVADGNREALAAFGDAVFPEPARSRVVLDTARALDAGAARLDQRRADGFVRQCHGDLHLGNIVLLDGAPTLFDAVEFNDDISCIDVAYDLAFLLMDLWHRGLPRHANFVLNEYLRLTGDLESLALLPLFLACRATVRAKTNATAATLADAAAARQPLVEAAHQYLELAQRFLVSARAGAGGGGRPVWIGQVHRGRSGGPRHWSGAGCAAPSHRPHPQAPLRRGAAHAPAGRGLLRRHDRAGVCPPAPTGRHRPGGRPRGGLRRRLRRGAGAPGPRRPGRERAARRSCGCGSTRRTPRCAPASRPVATTRRTPPQTWSARQAAHVQPPPDWARVDASGPAEDTAGRLIAALGGGWCATGDRESAYRPRIAGVMMPTRSTPAPFATSITEITSP